MSIVKNTKIIFIVLALCVLWLVGAAFFPVIMDEAYYFFWSRHLAFGYFDHPPLVAVLGFGANLANQLALARLTPLVSRAGTMLCGIFTVLAVIKLFKSLLQGQKEAFFIALVLALFNLGSLVLGFLTTPDAALMLFWTLALHEGYRAAKDSPTRWITAGLAVGLGLQVPGPAFGPGHR